MTDIITSIEVKHTNAPYLRITAKIDMPEYGIAKGDICYLVHSETESQAQGKRMYHIVRWSYDCICWACPCNGFYYRSECSHAHIANIACSARKACMEMVLGSVLNNIGVALREKRAAKKPAATTKRSRAEAPIGQASRGFSLPKSYAQMEAERQAIAS